MQLEILWSKYQNKPHKQLQSMSILYIASKQDIGRRQGRANQRHCSPCLCRWFSSHGTSGLNMSQWITLSHRTSKSFYYKLPAWIYVITKAFLACASLADSADVTDTCSPATHKGHAASLAALTVEIGIWVNKSAGWNPRLHNRHFGTSECTINYVNYKLSSVKQA